MKLSELFLNKIFENLNWFENFLYRFNGCITNISLFTFLVMITIVVIIAHKKFPEDRDQRVIIITSFTLLYAIILLTIFEVLASNYIFGVKTSIYNEALKEKVELFEKELNENDKEIFNKCLNETIEDRFGKKYFYVNEVHICLEEKSK